MGGAHAFGSEAVDVEGDEIAASIAGHIGIPEVVGEDEQMLGFDDAMCPLLPFPSAQPEATGLKICPDFASWLGLVLGRKRNRPEFARILLSLAVFLTAVPRQSEHFGDEDRPDGCFHTGFTAKTVAPLGLTKSTN